MLAALFAGQDNPEAGAAPVALGHGHVAAVPVNDALYDGQPQAVAAAGAVAAFVEPGERLEDPFALVLGDAGAVVVHVQNQAVVLLGHRHPHPGFRVPQGVGDQILQNPVQVARVPFHGQVPGAARVDQDIPADVLQLPDQLVAHFQQEHRLELDVGGALLQPRIGEDLINQLIQLLDVPVQGVELFPALVGGFAVRQHLQAEAQPRHRGAQFVGHRPGHFPLRLDKTADVRGHAVESGRHLADRVVAGDIRVGAQVAAAQPLHRPVQAPQAGLQRAHLQVGGQRHQQQGHHAGDHQQLPGELIEQMQRAHHQNAFAAGHRHQHPHAGVAPGAVGEGEHHLVALQTPLLFHVQVQLGARQQRQGVTEMLVEIGQGAVLLVGRTGAQVVEHQHGGGAGLLFGETGHDGADIKRVTGDREQHLHPFAVRVAAQYHPAFLQMQAVAVGQPQLAGVAQGHRGAEHAAQRTRPGLALLVAGALPVAFGH